MQKRMIFLAAKYLFVYGLVLDILPSLKGGEDVNCLRLKAASTYTREVS